MAFDIMLLFFINISILLTCVCCGAKCNRNTDSGVELFCCDNFEFRDGTCVECEHGYASPGQGNPCKQCSSNMYGKRCAGICNCNSVQRCDHIKGCVNDPSIIEKTTENEVASTYIKVLLQTTDISEHIDSTLQPISIYSICAAVVTVLLVLGMILMLYRRRRAGSERQERDNGDQNIKKVILIIEK